MTGSGSGSGSPPRIALTPSKAMADNAENGSPVQQGMEAPQPPTEHLNIKVTDNNNPVFQDQT